MIKFVRAADIKDLQLTGVSIIDLSDKSVTFKTDKGEMLRVDHDGYSSIRIMVPEKPKFKIMHIIEGEYQGLKFPDVRFESEFEAKEKLFALGSDIRDNFKISPVQVEIL